MGCEEIGCLAGLSGNSGQCSPACFSVGRFYLVCLLVCQLGANAALFLLIPLFAVITL
jgi:hypothetical protein